MTTKGGKRKREREQRDEDLKSLEKKRQKSIDFKNKASLIIKEMVKLNTEHTTLFLDEMLHSIFFLGKLNDPQFSPESIVSDAQMLNALKNCFPRPFDLYSSQLPRRSPFSCVLDMIVHMTGQENESEIIRKLRELITLKLGQSNHLVSSTICVSHSTNLPHPVRYYGVSMSTSGCYPGRIMVAASCLSSWHRYVADAVMTYYPNKTKKPYFDGTINLPHYVRCQAFSLSTNREKSPCRSCGNLFGLTTTETNESAYGNCAEAESVSKLLGNVGEIRVKSRPTSETYTDENRKTVKKSVMTELNRLLRELKFEWDENFYIPNFVVHATSYNDNKGF